MRFMAALCCAFPPLPPFFRRLYLRAVHVKWPRRQRMYPQRGSIGAAGVIPSSHVSNGGGPLSLRRPAQNRLRARFPDRNARGGWGVGGGTAEPGAIKSILPRLFFPSGRKRKSAPGSKRVIGSGRGVNTTVSDETAGQCASRRNVRIKGVTKARG